MMLCGSMLQAHGAGLQWPLGIVFSLIFFMGTGFERLMNEPAETGGFPRVLCRPGPEVAPEANYALNFFCNFGVWIDPRHTQELTFTSNSSQNGILHVSRSKERAWVPRGTMGANLANYAINYFVGIGFADGLLYPKDCVTSDINLWKCYGEAAESKFRVLVQRLGMRALDSPAHGQYGGWASTMLVIAATYLWAKDLQSCRRGYLFVQKAVTGCLFASFHRGRSSYLSMWLATFICLAMLPTASGVTCFTCFDQIDGCTGGAGCLFLTRTNANFTALAAAGGAAITVASLLPLSYIRHLPSQVLRTLAAIARRPADGAPPDLGPMALGELQETLDSGRIDIGVLRGELSTRLADPATHANQVTRIAAMIQSLPANNTVSLAANIDGINTVGSVGYLVAVASLIVSNGGRSYSSGVASGSTSTSTKPTMAIKLPTRSSAFFEMLMVWQALAHATGVANYLASTPFVQQVVFDSINCLGFSWQQAYCLFLIYVEAVEDSRGQLNLGNVFAHGAHDMRIKAASIREKELFDSKNADKKEEEVQQKKWNGKDSPNASKICRTFNFKDAKHPDQHLYKDGTCKFRHVCMQWVTGKGPNGCCEGAHPKFDCTNPGKCQTAEK
jgi:hypothetical protein